MQGCDLFIFFDATESSPKISVKLLEKLLLKALKLNEGVPDFKLLVKLPILAVDFDIVC